jgi:hypothetical protein
MLTRMKIVTCLISAALMLAQLSGCAGLPVQQGAIYQETDADKYYRDAADQWVDYGF